MWLEYFYIIPEKGWLLDLSFSAIQKTFYFEEQFLMLYA